MSKTNNFRNSIQLVGVIFGGLLISLPVVSTANAQQQPTAQLNRKANPCPSIFYEEPHNSRVLVPSGCRANAFTSRTNAQGSNPNSVGATPSSRQTQLGVGGEAPYNSSGSTSQNYNQGIPNSQIDPNTGNRVNGPAGGYSNQRSSMESQTNNTRYRNAVATVSPTDGRVNVRLVNKTNAAIVYQVIGDTQLRTLAGRSEIMLQGLRTPTNVAFYRQDRGLLMVTPQGSSRNGMLDVTLQETTDFAMDRTSMRIENNGSVYLN